VDIEPLAILVRSGPELGFKPELLPIAIIGFFFGGIKGIAAGPEFDFRIFQEQEETSRCNPAHGDLNAGCVRTSEIWRRGVWEDAGPDEIPLWVRACISRSSFSRVKSRLSVESATPAICKNSASMPNCFARHRRRGVIMKATLDTHQKALQINLDPTCYGTFAEIGAGQEVARSFFRVGGASGTIAKSISASDVTFSDAIYGPSRAHISRQRLQTMLDYEYGLLQERLHPKRGSKTRFFVFADTVKVRPPGELDESHGWLGIRFQPEPLAEPSEIILHVRMLDREHLLQQEAIGILGVNLLYSAQYSFAEPETIIASLRDNLTSERLEVDMIKFSGPAFSGIDNRLMSLRLVQHGLANATLFTANGEVVQPGEFLFQNPILVERGSFRPVTKATLDMLDSAKTQFLHETHIQPEELVVLMEITIKNLATESGIDPGDFLDRADLLAALGHNVLISNFGEYYRLASYLFRYTKRNIGIVLGVPSLEELFEEKYYAHLEGGILESFGRLFKNDLKLFVYPLLIPSTGSIITARNFRVAPHLRHLYSFLMENKFIQGLQQYEEKWLPIFSRDVLAKIQKNDSLWQEMVPPEVARLIKDRQLFGYAKEK
jgi:hypothetical protein